MQPHWVRIHQGETIKVQQRPKIQTKTSLTKHAPKDLINKRNMVPYKSTNCIMIYHNA